jgi:AAA ATPase domain
MNPRDNPYAPGTGNRPPSIAGREEELEDYSVLLDRLKRGNSARGMILTGLRGVGKTALLKAFERASLEHGWVAVGADLDDRMPLAEVIARSARRALLGLELKQRAAERARFALEKLTMFTLRDADAFELSHISRVRTSHDALGEDFGDLLTMIGDVAGTRGRGVVFLLDELQYAPVDEFSAFVEGMQRASQRSLPITCVAAGLPTLPKLRGRAKSHFDRLFDRSQIGRLRQADAYSTLTTPAAELDVSWDRGALEYVFEETSGYPWFLQEYGKHAWNGASKDRITEDDARSGGVVAQAHLDNEFFGAGFEERATPAERQMLRTMSRCEGPPYSIADLTRSLGKDDQRALSMHRDRLIRKGLIYVPRRGSLDFTAPGFVAYLSRSNRPPPEVVMR